MVEESKNQRTSKRQRELLNYVDEFIKEFGYGPSYREIMRALGYKSVSTVAVHINGLIAKGYLNKRNKSARSLEVVTLAAVEPVKNRHAPTPAQEKWLITAITDRFDDLDKQHNDMTLDELYVLIGTLKVLGLEGAHVAMRTRLIDYVKKRG